MTTRAGRIVYEIGVKGTRKVESELSRVESQAKKTTGRLGEGFSRAGKSAERFQSLVGKIAIPVAAVSAIAGIANQLKQAVKEARQFQREVEGITKQINSLRSQQLQDSVLTSDAAREVAKIQSESAAAIEQLVSKQSELAENTSVLGQAWRGVSSVFTDSATTLSEQTDLINEQIKEIERTTSQRIAIARREARKRAEAEAEEFERVEAEKMAKKEQAEMERIDREKKARIDAEIKVQQEARRLQRETFDQFRKLQEDAAGRAGGSLSLDATNVRLDRLIQATRANKDRGL